MIVGRRIVFFPRLASTMDEIDRLAAAGEPEGIVVVTDEQTAGRGRAGRSWHAPAGTSVLCSVLLRPTVPADRITTLPLIAGAAVAEAIEQLATVRCQLKWPNDVWIDGQKVAGILMTSRAGSSGIAHANLGIGINVSTPPDALPPGATSLELACDCTIQREELLCALLAHLDVWYKEFCARGADRGLDAWRSRAALLDAIVTISTADGDVTGRFIGIDDAGALLLAQDTAIQRIVAGDLTRGPRILSPTKAPSH